MSNATVTAKFPQMVEDKLRATLVMKNGVIFNTKFNGNPTTGSAQIPFRDTEVVASSYTASTGLSVAAQSATSYVEVLMDEDIAVNELIDGFTAASAPDNIVAERLDSAVYSIGLNLDVRGATALLGTGTQTGALEAITSSNIYDTFVDQRTALSNAKVPNDGRRWALVKPECYALMLKDTTNFIRQGDMAQKVKETGAIGQYCGFNIYEYTIDSTNAAAYPNFLFMVGHPDWCTRIEAWRVPPAIKDLANEWIGSSAVQGRYVNKHKVTRAAAVRVFNQIGSLTCVMAAGATGKSGITVTGFVASGESAVGTFVYRARPNDATTYGQAVVSGANGYLTFTNAAADGVTIATQSIANTNTIEVVQVLNGVAIARGTLVATTATIG